MANVQLTAPNGCSYSQPTGLFINNEFVPAKSGQTLETINPYDETVIAKVAAADAEDVDAAVAAARKALSDPDWKGLSAADRGRLIWKLADLCEENAHVLATIDAWDNGKPYSVALDEDVAEVVGVLRYYAGWADKVHGKTIEPSPAKFAYTRHEPVGVCGMIIPWNYPVMMAAWKLGPALACGNTLVLKAAEQTPLSVLYLATLVVKAGFPPGVVNIINGYGAKAGAALAGHMGVDKIAFTGSTNTGRVIMRSASANLKNITLETGGKSPLLVFEDANLDQAVKWSHVGIMSNMGQICTATSRIYVQSSIYDKFVQEFAQYTKENSILGSQFDSKTNHGPQVSKVQRDKILEYVNSAKSEGAELILGGGVKDGSGYFIEPTIFGAADNKLKIVQEEIFGPFVVVQSFASEEEVIRKANDSQYGLGAAVFTQNITRAHRVAGEIQAGMVWDSHFAIPFGGYKQSGIGRELGEYALSAYTQVKAVHVNLGLEL